MTASVQEDDDQIWLGLDTDFPFAAARTQDGVTLFGGHPMYAYSLEDAGRLEDWLYKQLKGERVASYEPPF